MEKNKQILQAIAANTPHSFEEIEKLFDRCRSYDHVLRIIAVSSSCGVDIRYISIHSEEKDILIKASRAELAAR